jgi:hypothetical protein
VPFAPNGIDVAIAVTIRSPGRGRDGDGDDEAIGPVLQPDNRSIVTR